MAYTEIHHLPSEARDGEPVVVPVLFGQSGLSVRQFMAPPAASGAAAGFRNSVFLCCIRLCSTSPSPHPAPRTWCFLLLFLLLSLTGAPSSSFLSTCLLLTGLAVGPIIAPCPSCSCLASSQLASYNLMFLFSAPYLLLWLHLLPLVPPPPA